MPRRCSVCIHPDRQQIDQAIVSGNSYRTVAQQFAISRDAVVRHRRHLSVALSLAKTLGVLSFTPLTMLQACAQAVDFKVGHHFGEGQP
jgi:hypothetical protein